MAGDKAQSNDKNAVAETETPQKAQAEVRQPADPRLKFMKKFEARFLPKGPLRDRHKSILARWSSNEDHGGVTLEELKSLMVDWRASRDKTKKPTTAK